MPAYGYARVSTDGQTLDAQVAQLKAAGAEKVFREKVSGVRADRPELARLMRALSPGDVVMTGTPKGTLVETAIRDSKPWDDPSVDWLKDGDVVESEIEGIGILRNMVAAE